jgi:hypothetical protein
MKGFGARRSRIVARGGRIYTFGAQHVRACVLELRARAGGIDALLSKSLSQLAVTAVAHRLQVAPSTLSDTLLPAALGQRTALKGATAICRGDAQALAIAEGIAWT